jgi:hypothetical protein
MVVSCACGQLGATCQYHASLRGTPVDPRGREHPINTVRRAHGAGALQLVIL